MSWSDKCRISTFAWYLPLFSQSQYWALQRLAQIDSAIEKGGKIDLSSVEKKLQQISSITRDLNRLTSGDDVSFSRNAQWGTSGNKVLDYSLSSLVDSLKRLEGQEDA